MDVTDVKGLAAASIWFVSALGGLLPFLLKRRQADDAAYEAAHTHLYSAQHQHQPHPQHTHHQTNLTEETTSGESSPQHTQSLLPQHILVVDDGSTDVSVPNGGFKHASFREKHPHEADARTALRGGRRALSSDAAATTRYGSMPPGTPPLRPIPRRRCQIDVDRFLSLGNMLGAGIFLGGGLMHLLPESNEGLLEIQKDWSYFDTFPFAFFLAGIGFYTILIVEELTIAITNKRHKSKADKATAAAAASSEINAVSVAVSPKLHSDIPDLEPCGEVPFALVTAEAEAHANKKAKKVLQRTLVQGLTPRLALVAGRPGHDHHPPHDHLAEELCEDLAAGAECCDSDTSDREESQPGPISSFLNAAYDSPSPFPTLAERHDRQRRARRQRQLRMTQDDSGDNSPAGSDQDDVGTEDEIDGVPRRPSATAASAIGTKLHLDGTTLGASSSSHSVGHTSMPLLREPLLSAGAVSSSQHKSIAIEETKAASASFMPTLKKKPSIKSITSRPPVDDDHPHSHHSSHPNNVDSDHASHHGHGHGGEDGHSHVSINPDTSYVVAYLLVMALSFHSIFEGIALGTQEKMATTVSIFIAIIAHSPLAGFALGVSLVKSRAAPRMALSCLFIFTIMTPLGTILGLLLSYTLDGNTLTITSCVFQAFSAGTFLFVALEEIIPKELAIPKDKPIKMTLAVVGFMAMAAIKLFDTD